MSTTSIAVPPAPVSNCPVSRLPLSVRELSVILQANSNILSAMFKQWVTIGNYTYTISIVHGSHVNVLYRSVTSTDMYHSVLTSCDIKTLLNN